MIQYILWISIHPFKTHFVPAKHSFRTIYIFHLQLKCSRPLISLPGHWSNLEQKMVYFMILISEQHQAIFIKSSLQTYISTRYLSEPNKRNASISKYAQQCQILKLNSAASFYLSQYKTVTDNTFSTYQILLTIEMYTMLAILIIKKKWK